MFQGNAAKIIQCYFRRAIEHRKYLKLKGAVLFLQTVIRAWLMAKRKSVIYKFSPIIVQEYSSGICLASDFYLLLSLQISQVSHLKSFSIVVQENRNSRKHMGGTSFLWLTGMALSN